MACAAAPEIKPPLPDVALAVVVSVPVAVTCNWAVVGFTPGAERLTPSPIEASVVLLEVDVATLDPAATMPTAIPDASAFWLVSFVALTVTFPDRERMLSSPTLPVT